MQKINDEPVKQCPQCYESTAIRLISAAGFQLKGSGWYATDFKTKGRPDVKTENNTGSGEKSVEKKAGDAGSSTSDKPSKKGDAE